MQNTATPTGIPFSTFMVAGTSRLEPLLLGDEVFIRLGLRLIAPDRPGIGQSDFQLNRRFFDWTKDVTFLSDALGLDKFSVLGVSSGRRLYCCLCCKDSSSIIFSRDRFQEHGNLQLRIC